MDDQQRTLNSRDDRFDLVNEAVVRGVDYACTDFTRHGLTWIGETWGAPEDLGEGYRNEDRLRGYSERMAEDSSVAEQFVERHEANRLYRDMLERAYIAYMGGISAHTIGPEEASKAAPALAQLALDAYDEVASSKVPRDETYMHQRVARAMARVTRDRNFLS